MWTGDTPGAEEAQLLAGVAVGGVYGDIVNVLGDWEVVVSFEEVEGGVERWGWGHALDGLQLVSGSKLCWIWSMKTSWIRSCSKWRWGL